jgi:hypothetical protein
LNNRGTNVNLVVSKKMLGMRRQILFVFAFALLSAANSSAQQKKSAQPPVLPDAFGTWHVTSCVDRPEHPALSQEAGMRDFRACEFSSDKQKAGMWAGRYRDPSSAYEVYTSRLRRGMQPSTVGKFTAVDDKGLLALVGDIVVEVLQPRNISTTDLQQLTSMLAARSDKTPLPPIRAFLPQEDLENATQRYALGPEGFRQAAETLGRPEFATLAEVVGFSSGAEAMLARYKAGALLILIDYPTPQLAELHLRHLETSLPEKAKQGGTTIERKGSLLSMVIAPATPGYAAKLRDGVNYETQVTWNEPSGTATDAPWGVVLYRIFVGTGIFMVAAVVLGIGFGGIRIFTKRLFPGKVFDRPEQMEVLQLGLSGKRIDPRDFY